MRANTVQLELTLGTFGVEAVPTKAWREELAARGKASYTHAVEGKASALCEDGVTKAVVHLTARLFGNPRCSTLGGLVAKWAYRPSKGSVHAQAKLTADGKAFADATPVFTEPDIVGPGGAALSPSLGLVLSAELTKGKTLRFAGVEMAQRMHRTGPAAGTPIVGKDGTLYYEITRFASVAVVDRPNSNSVLGGSEAPLSAEPATLTFQAARPAERTQEAPADALEL